MNTKKDFELLSAASNAIIAKHVTRNFPGVLLQGDTLSLLVDDMDELIEECQASNIAEAVKIAANVREQLADVLTHYERVLNDNGIKLPYLKPMSDRK